MGIKYEYTMRFDLSKVADLIEATIGRRPDGMGSAGWRGRTFIFDDVDVTPVERQAVLDAMPESLRLLFSFSRRVVVEPDE